MKKGFTLVEILITIIVIGVVAALTVPAVVQKYQQKQLYTQFIKMYNTLQNVMQLATLTEGSPNTWDFALSKKNFLDRYIAPYVKNQGYNANYLPAGTSIKSLSGENLGLASGMISNLGLSDFLMLDDGGAISVSVMNSYGKYVYLFVDVNGAKGPNIAGRDMFQIDYGFYNKKPFVGITANDSLVAEKCDINGSSTSNTIQGYLCGGKLLKEGKMDY